MQKSRHPQRTVHRIHDTPSGIHDTPSGIHDTPSGHYISKIHNTPAGGYCYISRFFGRIIVHIRTWTIMLILAGQSGCREFTSPREENLLQLHSPVSWFYTPPRAIVHPSGFALGICTTLPSEGCKITTRPRFAGANFLPRGCKFSTPLLSRE